MLRKLGLAFIMCLVPCIVSAQSSTAKTFITQQPCNTFDEILKTVTRYGEQSLFVGTGMIIGAGDPPKPFTGGAIFFVNQDTGTWTLVSLYADGTACIAANGTDFEPYVGDLMPTNSDKF